jgi:hypothetical protein
MITVAKYLREFYGYVDYDLAPLVSDSTQITYEPVYQLNKRVSGRKVTGCVYAITDLEKCHKKMFRVFGL